MCGLLVILAMSLPVFAGGTTKETCVTQYGGATECHTETITEEVTHETVNAGVGDNLPLISLGVVGVGAVFLILARLTRRVTVWS